MDFPIIGQFNIGRSREWQNQDTINFYACMDEDAKTPASLTPMPGTLFLLDVNNTEVPIRENGVFRYQNIYYVITGNYFYQIVEGEASLIGSINSSSGYISWSNNTTQIFFADGVNFWVYELDGSKFRSITTFDGDVSPTPFPPNAIACYYQDDRVLVCFSGNSNVYYYSNQGYAELFTSNGFITLNSQPDTSAGIGGSNERIFLFGHLNTEIWAPNTTSNLQPFFRDNNYIYEFGLGAIGSFVKGVIEYDKPNTPVVNFSFWLTQHKQGIGSFVLSTGGMPQKISTAAVDLQLSTFKTYSDCYCVIYKISGHVFIECNFPTENVTLVVDINTGWWYHKKRPDGSYSLINSHVYINGQHIVGSRVDSKLYLLSSDYLTENGTPVVHTRISETLIAPRFERITGNRFEVSCEAGSVPAGIIPYIFIYFSINGGKSWSNPFKLEMGRTGEYQWKTFIDGLGDGYAYTFKLEFYDPVRVYIFGADFDYTVSEE